MFSITSTPSWKFCPECGKKLEPAWNYCPECGYQLGVQLIVFSSPQPPQPLYPVLPIIYPVQSPGYTPGWSAPPTITCKTPETL